MGTVREVSERRQATAGGLDGHFRIVLIAASAGGLQALQSLLGTLPPDLDAAVVVLPLDESGPAIVSLVRGGNVAT